MTCGHKLNRVIDSRKKPYGTFRRRECTKCGNRFTTIEIEVGDLRHGESAFHATKRNLLSGMLIEMGEAMKK